MSRDMALFFAGSRRAQHALHNHVHPLR